MFNFTKQAIQNILSLIQKGKRNIWRVKHFQTLFERIVLFTVYDGNKLLYFKNKEYFNLFIFNHF